MSENTAGETLPIAGALPKSSQMTMGNHGIALNTVEDAFRFAGALITSGLAPKGFKTKEAVLIAIQMGAEIGLTPMAALQNIAVINDKPGLYGDAGKALLRAKGFDIEEQCDGVRAVCSITHERQKPVVRSFSMDDAKRANLWGKPGPWTQYPSRMLSWRAFWWAARDAAGDVLKGVSGVEETRDIEPEPRNVTPPPPSQRLSALDAPKSVTPEPQPESPPPSDSLFGMDAQTREDIERSRAEKEKAQ